MRKYYRHFRRMEPWSKVTMWVERGYLKPPQDYNLIKLFPQHQRPEDYPGYRPRVQLDPEDPYTKLRYNFLKKYPQTLDSYYGKNYSNNKLIETFIKKQLNLMKQGFSEIKSFDLVEKEMSSNLQAERYDRALFEGVKVSERTRSLMDVFEQREEFIQKQKSSRLEKELPEFLRAEYYKNSFTKEINNSLLTDNRNTHHNPNDLKNQILYEPVTYYLSNNKKENEDDDSKKSNFLDRSESLLNFYHSFHEISDGLSNTKEKEILRLAKESSQRFKNHFQFIHNKLKKFNIKLNNEGKIDFLTITNSSIRSFVKNNENLCNVILLCQDLDFEIPHQARQNEIRQNILDEIQEERERLNNLFNYKREEASRSIQKNVAPYEDIFYLNKYFDTDNIEGVNKRSDKKNFEIKKLLSYEEWEDTLSVIEKGQNLFQKDLEYKKYFYIESMEEKELRLRDAWLKSKERRMEVSVGKRIESSEESLEVRKEITSIIRSLRRQIDQYLVKNKKPIYFGTRVKFFDKKEFLYDAEINFHQIKRFLNVKSSILQKDPSIAKNYLDLMEAITRKRIIENSVANFERSEYYNQATEGGKSRFSKEQGTEGINEEEEISEKDLLKDTSAFLDEEVLSNSKILGMEKKESAREEKTQQKNLQNQAKKTKESLLSFFEDKVKESMGIKDKALKLSETDSKKKLQVKKTAVNDKGLDKGSKKKKSKTK